MSILYVFAGNNGSGKSSYRQSIKEELFSDVDIDNDAIIRKLRQQSVDNPVKSAGIETIKQFKNCINNKINFSIETTLSSKLSIKQIKEAKANKYTIIMYYLFLNNVDLNIHRVKFRHKQGGHHIPSADVIRRHTRSRNNLLKVKDIIDKLFIIDNSKRNSNLVKVLENGITVYKNEDYTFELF